MRLSLVQASQVNFSLPIASEWLLSAAFDFTRIFHQPHFAAMSISSLKRVLVKQTRNFVFQVVQVRGIYEHMRVILFAVYNKCVNKCASQERIWQHTKSLMTICPLFSSFKYRISCFVGMSLKVRQHSEIFCCGNFIFLCLLRGYEQPLVYRKYGIHQAE